MAEIGGFTQLLMSLEQADFFTGVLPFVLTYVLFFLALGEVPIFKGNEQIRRLRALVSTVLALFVSYFIVTNPAYELFFVDFFGTFVVGLVGLLGLLVALGFTGMSDKIFTMKFWGLLAVVIAVAAWTNSGGAGLLLPGFGFPALGGVFETMMETGLIWVTLIVGLLWWAGKSPTASKPSLTQRIWKDLFMPEEREE